MAIKTRVSSLSRVSQPPRLKSMLRYAFQRAPPKKRRGGVVHPCFSLQRACAQQIVYSAGVSHTNLCLVDYTRKGNATQVSSIFIFSFRYLSGPYLQVS